MRLEIFELKSSQEKLKSRNEKLENNLSEISRMKSEFNQVESDIRTLKEDSDKVERLEIELSRTKSENSKLQKDLSTFEEVKVQFDKCKLDNSVSQKRTSAEIINLKKNLEEIISSNVEMKEQLENQTIEIDNLKKENDSLKKSVDSLEEDISKEKEKGRSTLAELELSKKLNQYLNNLSKSRNAIIHQMKLNEEKEGTNETSKMENCPKNFRELKSNSDNFVSIKSALEKIFKVDESFCETMSLGDEFEDLEDLEICEIAKFMLSDYLEVKKLHISEVKKCQDQLETKRLENFKKLNGLIAMLKNKNDAIDKLTFELKNKSETVKRIEAATAEHLNQTKARETVLLSKLKRLDANLKTQNNEITFLRLENHKMNVASNLSVGINGSSNDVLYRAELERKTEEIKMLTESYHNNLKLTREQVIISLFY